MSTKPTRTLSVRISTPEFENFIKEASDKKMNKSDLLTHKMSLANKLEEIKPEITQLSEQLEALRKKSEKITKYFGDNNI